MLVESEHPVKIETQVAPMLFGFEGGITSVWSIPEVEGNIVVLPSPSKVEELCLVVFQDEPRPSEEFEETLVSVPQKHTVLFNLARLDNDCAIVDVGDQSGDSILRSEAK
jgi:hypothetical protein